MNVANFIKTKAPSARHIKNDCINGVLYPIAISKSAIYFYVVIY